MGERIQYFLLALALLGGCYLRTVNIGLPVLGDDGSYLYKSKEVYSGLKAYEEVFLGHPPLNHVLTAYAYRVFGVGIASGRLSSVLFSIASIPLVFIVARRYYGFESGLLAAAVFSLSYGVVHFTSQALLYSEALFFSLLATHLFLLDGRRNSALAGLAAGVAAWGRMNSIVVLAAMLAYSLIKREHERVLPVAGGFIFAAAPMALLYPVDGLLDQILFYHMAKPSFSLATKLKYLLTVTTSYYPVISVIFVSGMWMTVKSGGWSEPDMLYSLNAFLALLSTLLLSYAHPNASAAYVTPSIYAFLMVGCRATSRFSRHAMLGFAFLLLASASTVTFTASARDGMVGGNMMAEVEYVISYVEGNSSPEELLLVDDYILHYIPLLSRNRMVPGADLNEYRLKHTLTFEGLEDMKSQAGYVIMSGEGSCGEIPEDLAEIGARKREVLLEDTRLAYRTDSIYVYEVL
ncbi:MAG: hypothetical protein GF416_07595 [Candidatus Altiarchaeales archaeon]|nr:hypothetical protein [Candidatus Altiarchaeales archaeon]MBD3416975.1 hypothetical protein [Candidatus Altiarchaeales archaeon]